MRSPQGNSNCLVLKARVRKRISELLKVVENQAQKKSSEEDSFQSAVAICPHFT
jgi:hypothetical protein